MKEHMAIALLDEAVQGIQENVPGTTVADGCEAGGCYQVIVTLADGRQLAITVTEV